MFKFFQVDHEDDHDKHPGVDVNMMDDQEFSEEDIGQVVVDVLDGEDALTIVAPLAGIDLDNIDVGLARNVLTIKGNRKQPDVYVETVRQLVGECFYGPFSRSIILPENLGFNKVEATMENNLLIVTIPKLTLPSKSIKIQRLED